MLGGRIVGGPMGATCMVGGVRGSRPAGGPGGGPMGATCMVGGVRGSRPAGGPGGGPIAESWGSTRPRGDAVTGGRIPGGPVGMPTRAETVSGGPVSGEGMP
jgi:hypothetical protein